MHRPTSVRIRAMLGVFLFVFSVGTASAAPRAEEARSTEAVGFLAGALSEAREAFIALMSDIGASLDPFGRPQGGSTPPDGNGE